MAGVFSVLQSMFLPRIVEERKYEETRKPQDLLINMGAGAIILRTPLYVMTLLWPLSFFRQSPVISKWKARSSNRMDKFTFVCKDNQNFSVGKAVIKSPTKVQRGSTIKRNDVAAIRGVSEMHVGPGVTGEGSQGGVQTREFLIILQFWRTCTLWTCCPIFFRAKTVSVTSVLSLSL